MLRNLVASFSEPGVLRNLWTPARTVAVLLTLLQPCLIRTSILPGWSASCHVVSRAAEDAASLGEAVSAGSCTAGGAASSEDLAVSNSDFCTSAVAVSDADCIMSVAEEADLAEEATAEPLDAAAWERGHCS